MNLTQALLILRARWKIVLLAPLLTVAAAVVVTLLTPKTYQATTSLVLNYKGSDPVTGQAMASQLLPGYMATQMEIVSSMSVALKVVDALKLADGPEVQERFQASTGGAGQLRDWLASGLLGRLKVQPARESSVLQISYLGNDPQMAAKVANAFAAAYLQASIDLKVQPSQRTAVYFDGQVKTLRNALETAQQRLSKYQQENGIVSTDRSLDVESVRLNELSSQAVVAQGLAMEAAARGRNAKGGAGSSPDVANNPLIQNLKIALGVAESKLSEVAERLGKNHPQYQSAQAEVDKLRADLAAQVRQTSSAVSANSDILRQRSDEAAAALRAQRDKVLRLNRVRDELTVLAKEVDSAQRAYDTVAQRLAVTNIEAQANQSDVAVLTPALAPFRPSGPKLVLNILIGLAAGRLLGVGGGVLLELMDRRVRSGHDLRESAGLVLLGTIGGAPANRPRKVA